jgi:predicted DNA-binding transcriptional regulator AlpA
MPGRPDEFADTVNEANVARLAVLTAKEELSRARAAVRSAEIRYRDLAGKIESMRRREVFENQAVGRKPHEERSADKRKDQDAPPDHLMDGDAVDAMWGGIGKTTRYRFIQMGLIPKPIKLSRTQARWSFNECNTALEEFKKTAKATSYAGVLSSDAAEIEGAAS